MMLKQLAVCNFNRNDCPRVSKEKNVIHKLRCNRFDCFLGIICIPIEKTDIICDKFFRKAVNLKPVVLRLIASCPFELVSLVMRGNHHLTPRVFFVQKPYGPPKKRLAADLNQMFRDILIVSPSGSLAVCHNDIFHNLSLI